MNRPLVEKTRIRSQDVIGEAVAAIAARPRRLALTISGLALAVAAFVAIPGLASTATGQIASAFNERLPTHVRITVTQRGGSQASGPFPADVERRLRALHGVLAAGTYWRLTLKHPQVLLARPASGLASPPAGPTQPGGTPASQIPPSATAPAATPPPGGKVPAGTPAGSSPAGTSPAGVGPAGTSPAGVGPAGTWPALFAATPGFLTAAGAQVSQGRLFNSWDQDRAEPVCVLGTLAARRLAVASVRHLPAILLNGLPCTVIGIIRHVGSQPWILSSVLMPSSTAIAFWDAPADRAGAEPGVLVRTTLGAARLIAGQAPFAINPLDPARYTVTVPPSPARLRSQVVADLIGLYVALAWASLLAGAVGIGLITAFAMTERAAEIGLRRALGARRRHIAAQIVAESAFLGLLGGLIGAGVGVLTVAGMAIALGWVPVIAPQAALSAPLIGAAIGVVASLYPALRAAQVAPARALSGYPGLESG